MAKVQIDPDTGCWLWTGAIHPLGYARFYDGRRLTQASRWAWEHWRGPIPDGYEVDHLCRTRHCVNYEAHLEPVPKSVNQRRSESPAGHHSRQTQCVHGHDFTEANTYTTKNGRRQCRKCMVIRNQRVRSKRRAA